MPRIGIPLPKSGDPEYVERALPQYERAVEMAGGEPVRIPLDRSSADVQKIAEQCDAILLPGSSADIEPARYGVTEKHPQTSAADPLRDAVDNLLLESAYGSRKPVLAICYGLQSLNVYCRGTLVQHIESAINHEAGRKVPVAHQVAIDPGSRLGTTLGGGPSLSLPVNSSHHQAADVVGEGLRVVARCSEDGVIEALEGTAPDHFVLAVQWHPERSAEDDEASRAIFRALVNAAKARPRKST
ncbi:MAG TPA: gamma-glutamyl-gamma-aminobutyrate hydrolase family protein [Terriglobales bacterium]|jgi:putative glutamine amidotransferase